MDWHKHTHKHTLVNTQHLQKSSGNSELSSHERSSGGNRDWTNVRKKKPKSKNPFILFFSSFSYFLSPVVCFLFSPPFCLTIPSYFYVFFFFQILSSLFLNILFSTCCFFYWILNSYLFSPKHWVTVSLQVIITTSFMTEISFTFCCLPNLAISPSISQENRTSMNTQKEPATVRCHPFILHLPLWLATLEHTCVCGHFIAHASLPVRFIGCQTVSFALWAQTFSPARTVCPNFPLRNS